MPTYKPYEPNVKPAPGHPFATQLIQQFSRPGSPAVLLSLVVVVCFIATAAMVSMARRRTAG